VQNSRAFEDVIFGAILGVWTIKVPNLWDETAPVYRPLFFLIAAATLALALRALYSPVTLPARAMRLIWVLVGILMVSAAGISAGIFDFREGIFFGLLFGVWSLTSLVADLLYPLLPERIQNDG
jgi:hypothetical protein